MFILIARVLTASARAGASQREKSRACESLFLGHFWNFQNSTACETIFSTKITSIFPIQGHAGHARHAGKAAPEFLFLKFVDADHEKMNIQSVQKIMTHPVLN